MKKARFSLALNSSLPVLAAHTPKPNCTQSSAEDATEEWSAFPCDFGGRLLWRVATDNKHTEYNS